MVPFSIARGVNAPLNLNNPSAMAVNGTTLWITNQLSSSLTAVNALTGALLRTVAPSDLGVGRPDAIVSTSNHLFVASVGGPLSELTTLGRHIRTMRPAGCSVTSSTRLALVASTQLVELCSNGAVNLFSTTTGTLIRSIRSATSHLNNATAMTVVANKAFITNVTASDSNDGVVEINLSTGRWMATLSNTTNALFAFSSPMGIASDGHNLWVTNQTSQSVTEIALNGLSYVQTIDSGYGFYLPATVMAVPGTATSPTTVYVTSYDGPTWSMVTKFTSSAAAPRTYGWMMCNTNDNYQFNNPTALALAGQSLWVINSANNLLDQLDPITGKLTATYA